MSNRENKQFKETSSYQRLVEISNKSSKDFKDEITLKSLLNAENRFRDFSVKQIDDVQGEYGGNFLLDFSKTHLNKAIFIELLQLVEEVGLRAGIKSMFNGEVVNWTEGRSVLHTLLRSFYEEGNRREDFNKVKVVRNKIKNFSEAVRSGKWRGVTNKKIESVVNIGIGGSFLGPKMVVEALKDYSGDLKIYFISNLDGSDAAQVFKQINPETSLFLIASKTFTTEETMTNASLAKEWMREQLGDKPEVVAKHFVAMSTNYEQVKAFGIDSEQIFEFWDFVGGRFSSWSAIGLPIALSIGYAGFEEFLKGGEIMDKHFLHTPFSGNLPVIMALITFWYIECRGYSNYANLPYSQLLIDFPSHLQQLDMESNGKAVSKFGEVDYSTAPITWGTVGTNGQHSFYQLIHQGTVKTLIDFIGVVNPNHNKQDSHDKLTAHLFAQSEALAIGFDKPSVVAMMKAEGKSQDEIKLLLPHRLFKGNRPSSTLMIDKITPRSVGKLLALYEHRTMVMGHLWGINSFDQWGVELGKKGANKILEIIKNKSCGTRLDSSGSGEDLTVSSKGLLKHYFNK